MPLKRSSYCFVFAVKLFVALDWMLRRFARAPEVKAVHPLGVYGFHTSPFLFAPSPSWAADLKNAARASEKHISYDIKIFDELAWRKQKFEFKKDAWDPAKMSTILRNKLCLGNESQEFTVIGEAFPFPDRDDSPVINEPQFSCKLLWDHNSPTEKIMIQLSDHFPPLLWITVKPSLEALRRVFSEFIEVDAQHMNKYLPYYESVQNSLETASSEKFGEKLSNVSMKDKFIDDMRKKDPRSLSTDWPNEHSVYLGTTEHFRIMEDDLMKRNPFVFGWPLLVGDGNQFMEGTPFRMSAFRTIFSKSMLMLNSRLDLQLDHRQAHLTATDDDDVLLEVPLFCTINYPQNARMCGGKALVERFNKVMGTTYPLDMPVDVLAAFAREQTVKGTTELLAEMEFLDAASKKSPDVERVVRISADQMSGNRIVGQLAYTIVYLSIVGYDDFIEKIFHRFEEHPADIIRVACAKGAHVFQRSDLIDKLISREEPGSRTRLMLERSRVGIADGNESS